MDIAPRQKAAGYTYEDVLVRPVIQALNAGEFPCATGPDCLLITVLFCISWQAYYDVRCWGSMTQTGACNAWHNRCFCASHQ